MIKTNKELEGVSDYDDDDDEDDGAEEDWTGVEDANWDNAATATTGDDGGDVKDESQAYMDFLKAEVSGRLIGGLSDHITDRQWHRQRSSAHSKIAMTTPL